MKRVVRVMAGVLLLLLIATGCSGGGNASWDPAEVQAEITTDPELARAGEEITLTATFIGTPNKPSTDMRFDIPQDGRSHLIKGQAAGDGSYTIPYTFPEAGTYDIYLHYYIDGEHITKIVKLEVS